LFPTHNDVRKTSFQLLSRVNSNFTASSVISRGKLRLGRNSARQMAFLTRERKERGQRSAIVVLGSAPLSSSFKLLAFHEVPSSLNIVGQEDLSIARIVHRNSCVLPSMSSKGPRFPFLPLDADLIAGLLPFSQSGLSTL
jgi:hypothetical protein